MFVARANQSVASLSVSYFLINPFAGRLAMALEF
jgi:hypothetical protein